MKYKIYILLLLLFPTTVFGATVTLTPTEIASDCTTPVTLTISGLNSGEYVVNFAPELGNPSNPYIWYQNWYSDGVYTGDFQTVMGIYDCATQLAPANAQLLGTWDFATIDGNADTGGLCFGGYYTDCSPFIVSNSIKSITNPSPAPGGTMTAGFVTSGVIIPQLGDYAYRIFLILAGVLGVMVAWLVFAFGWSKLRSFDRSGSLFGFYYWKTPYKGYNRFRSRKWNLENTMK